MSWVVFDAGTKKLCRQNQYFGVKAAQDYIRRLPDGPSAPPGLLPEHNKKQARYGWLKPLMMELNERLAA